MTVDEVMAEVEEIRKLADDDEAAHSAEDHLHRRVLEAIAHGTAVDPACAKAALLTQSIVFMRWCA